MISSRQITPRVLLLSVLVFVSAMPGLQIGHAVTSSNLSVFVSENVLVASRNNTIAMEISNVGKYVKELDVALTIPPPLVLFGDNHWIRPSFAPGDMITANLTIFAPSSAAATSLQGSLVAVYKAAGETTPSSETHAISFLVRGWIDMKVYEVTVSPDPALPGSEITISGNLLNRGVVAAMYANVTVAADQPLVADSIQSTYVGEVDPNAPAPFSVTALVDSTVSAGEYDVTILVYYRDDLQLDRVVSMPVSFSVISELPRTGTARTSITDQLMSSPLLLAALAVVVLLAVVGLYLRRRRRAPAT